MARISGWGGSPPRPLIGRHMRALRKRMKRVLETAVVDLDVWQVEITLEEGGKVRTLSDCCCFCSLKVMWNVVLSGGEWR